MTFEIAERRLRITCLLLSRGEGVVNFLHFLQFYHFSRQPFSCSLLLLLIVFMVMVMVMVICSLMVVAMLAAFRV